MVDFGVIIKKKNIAFKTNEIYKKELTIDHAKSGRPALIIGINDDYLYYLTITSRKHNDKRYPFYYPIEFDEMMKDSYVNLKDVYRQPVCGYKELGELDFETMAEVTEAFIEYQSNSEEKDEYFSEVLPLIKEGMAKYKNNTRRHF